MIVTTSQFQRSANCSQWVLGPGTGLGESQQAYAAIYGMVARQAMVLSYIDNFRALAFLCFLCVPAVFLFKRVKRKGAVAMH